MIDAKFFDIFGIIVFSYIIWLSISMIKNQKIAKWSKIILLLIGIAGLIIDGFLVINKYLI